METPPPTQSELPPLAPATRRRVWFWVSFLMVLPGVLFLVPFGAHMGPTLEGESWFCQNELESLAHMVDRWEQTHPGGPLVDLEDCRRVYQGEKSLTPSSEPFLSFLNTIDRNSPDSDAICLLNNERFSPHRLPGIPAKIILDFRYSRGPEDAPVEFHSWERAPRDAYLRHAHLRRNLRIAGYLGGLLLGLACAAWFLGMIVLGILESLPRKTQPKP